MNKARALTRKSIKVGKVLYEDMDRCDLFKHASGMAYITLLSIVPSLAAVFALVSVFAPFSGEKTPVVARVKSMILDNLAPGTGEQVVAYLDTFVANLEIGKIGVTGFIGILVSLILLLRQAELAINAVFDVRNERNFFSRFIYFWTFLTLGTFVASVGIGILSGFDTANLMHLGGIKPLYALASKLFTLSGVFVVFVALYKLVPNCRVHWRSALYGGVTAAFLFTVASQGYSAFIQQFTNYALIYGALAAVPVFLFWLYVLWLIVLFGSVVTYRHQLGMQVKQDEQVKNLSPAERLESAYYRLSLPALTLKTMYEGFAAGEGPITLGYLARRLGTSEGALKDALCLLEKGEWVKCIDDPADVDRHYLLIKPADKVRLGALAQSLGLARREQALVQKWFEVLAGKAKDETTFADLLAGAKT